MISLFQKCILLDMVCGNTKYNPYCHGMWPLLDPFLEPKCDKLSDFVKEITELRSEAFGIVKNICHIEIKNVFKSQQVTEV